MSDERIEEALALADEVAEALDDPKRGEWGGYPWEHLGDAERDVRELIVLAAALREAEYKIKLLNIARREDWAENERLREAIRAVTLDPERTARGPLTITRGQLELLDAVLAPADEQEKADG